MGKTSAIIVSDLHVNSTVGLSLPSVNLDEGGTYRASPTQRALWKAWLDMWDTIAKRELFEGRKVLFINGDIGELDTKRRSAQLITLNKAVVLRMVLDVLQPALDVVDSVVVIRGTMAHTGKSGWLEEAVADDLDNAIHDKDSASWWHFRGVTEGVRFDIAHHATMGRLPWTEKNAGNKIAAIIVNRYMVDMKQKPPDIAVRSHNHRYSDSGGNFETFAVCSPCWSGATEFVYRIGQENSVPSIGGLVFVCEDGKYDYYPQFYRSEAEQRIWATKF